MTNTTCNRCGELVEWRTTNNGRRVAFDPATATVRTPGPHRYRCERIMATREHNAQIERERAASAAIMRRLVTEYTDADALRYMSTGELPATF